MIRTEQAEIRAEVPRYQEMAERAGVFFFFEDEELPELPFFAVPGLELAARDRDGSWYGRSEALGEGCTASPRRDCLPSVRGHGPVFQPPAGGGGGPGDVGASPRAQGVPSKAEAAGQIRLIPLSELAPEALERGE